MSLGLSLNNALSGLKANQQAISVLSHNIANANTDGYSRQVVEQSALYVNGVGNGVRVDEVIRKVDKYLQRAVQTQGSEVARTNVVNDYFERINVLLGSPGGNNTLDEYISNFFTGLQGLSETPDRTSARSNVIAAAQGLASNISNMAYDLNDLRFEADSEIRASVDSVNALIRRLNSVNIALNNAGSMGNSKAGLLDERDAALRELSSYMSISTSYKESGEVSVITGDGLSLVDGQNRELRYSPTQSANHFINDVAVSPLQLVLLDENGRQIGNATNVFSGGTTGNVTSSLTSGKLEGLRMMRDDVVPAMLAQLDQLASNLRDAMNAIHNDGSGFPPASSLTATRSVTSSSATTWSGQVRIAVLKKDGTPVSANYADENYTGLRPLTLDLSKLNDGRLGSVTGKPSLQTIVDEINNAFASPGYKTTLGNLNNIRLVSNTDTLPMGVPLTNFNFDFEVENISGHDAQMFIGAVTVLDDTGTNITNVTQPAPTIALDPAAAYVTTNLSTDVIINLTGTHNLKVGDRIELGAPGSPTVNGIPAAALTGYFTITAVNGNSVTITAGAAATSSGSVADGSGVAARPPFNVPTGEVLRSKDFGQLGVDLSGNPSSTYFDISVAVSSFDENGNLVTSNVTYRVRNGELGKLNDRYDSIAATGSGVRTAPQTTQAAMRAILVDEKGIELPKGSDGRYVDREPSYLKLLTDNPDYSIVIDESSSVQTGDQTIDPPVAGTNRGFSHYFGLNDFFEPNEVTATGDTVKNSAINMKVAQRLIDNPNLISTGDLVQQRQSSDPNAPPQYTFLRYSGDNQIATRMKAMATQNLNFEAAGGLPKISLTASGYASEMLGYIASLSAAAGEELTNAQTLYDGFKTRSDAISGVNLDEELANTVIFQNSYSASARVVTVVNQLFEDLIGMLG